MAKVIAKYDARILIHDQDKYYFFLLILSTVALVCVKLLVRFEAVSPPVAGYEPVVPHGQQIYGYYGL